MELPQAAVEFIASAPLAHMVTLDDDGSPHVTVVWVGIEDGEIVSGHLGNWKKLRNVRRDPRVAMSMEGTRRNEIGLMEYLVVHGRARITEGGGAQLLQRLAHSYVELGTKFPPFDDPPPGVVMRVEVERIGGVGPWVG
ncbi:MAG TPA: TIGR03618 family F420-dependent PPOX class oxidoreductase [Acidimicrobiales bacterium]|nr:TIGR03618 family F420-dependent PPOX class oxidoreductase [Acidimicrobiales bacterium]